MMNTDFHARFLSVSLLLHFFFVIHRLTFFHIHIFIHNFSISLLLHLIYQDTRQARLKVYNKKNYKQVKLKHYEISKDGSAKKV
jgi:cytochrome b subunit of formate dehydrogenase